MSDDNEISIASEDVGDREATEEDDVGDEGAAEKQCGDGTKRKGCDDGNDVNVNVWPCSRMQAQSSRHGPTQDGDAEVEEWGGVGERIKQKLADTYKKMGCIAAVECHSLMLGEYNVQLTNSRRLVMKLSQQTYTCRQWQMRGLPCCHALAVIAKANLWVYDYVHPIYKTATQEVIYNQLVHPMETNDMAVADGKTGLVVGGG
ncbi:hypothetical protein Cgig2_022922 [Carnegiea gigantea]|uniref:SWIM-type domain-containing protein n=1 Tax=Carnegiea gigantea TaxID=171969 RepID=A0A9Q1K2L5_9CARY|nr:hypothetical protein Cgig2_022922 [Carnegiea gigantea]